MKIFVTGVEERLEEFKNILSSTIEADLYDEAVELEEIDLTRYDAIFDLTLDDFPEHLEAYLPLSGKPVIGCAVKVSLAEMVYLAANPDCILIGMNALPTFISRSVLEFSVYRDEDRPVVEKLCSKTGWECKIVKDRIGMVTPRVVFMIINEAFYTLQEGTASEADIDESMKLGTNYPFGPFEWCRMVGIAEVYETLESIYQDTHDERYKVCSLLKEAYLKNNF